MKETDDENLVRCKPAKDRKFALDIEQIKDPGKEKHWFPESSLFCPFTMNDNRYGNIVPANSSTAIPSYLSEVALPRVASERWNVRQGRRRHIVGPHCVHLPKIMELDVHDPFRRASKILQSRLPSGKSSQESLSKYENYQCIAK